MPKVPINTSDKNHSLDLLFRSLDGLTVGDSFGERFFGPPLEVISAIRNRTLPDPPWRLTDDSVMAIGISKILKTYAQIKQDQLADLFAENYRADPHRGYGAMAHTILRNISHGLHWLPISSGAFNGTGSFGNGAAMRVAPLGAYFADQGLEKVVEQARLSAKVTHYHPEGIAGAIAVAVAAAHACSIKNPNQPDTGANLLEAVIKHTPKSRTRTGICRATEMLNTDSVEQAVQNLGNGSRISAQDTVPFCLWCAGKHPASYEEAMWTTVAGLGDRDTTCAIVGGIVSVIPNSEPIPSEWLRSREPLEVFLTSQTD